jgi:predicted MFS family arabinose efflux permease
LISARLVQGIGGAMILPTSLSLLNANFRGRERGIAFAVWGSTIGGTAALGPLLGGWLTTSFSWRWAFGINVPLALVIVVGVLWCVAESRGPQRQGMDLLGAVLSAIGFAAIVFGLIEGRTYGWWTLEAPFSVFGWGWDGGPSPVPLALALGGAALVGFVFLELHRSRAGQAVLLDLRLFAIDSFRNGNIAAAIVSLGEFGLLFALPLWFQNVLGYSAFQTGLALLPLAVGSFVASGLAAAAVGRLSAVTIVRLGIVLEIIGIAGIGFVVRPDSAWWVTVPLLFVYGLGIGLATAQLTGVVLADVPVEQSGQASGTQSTARQLGSAFGIAILGTVLFTSLGALLRTSLDALPPAARQGVVDAVTQSAGTSIPELAAEPNGMPIYQAAVQAFTDATRYTAFTAAAFLIIGLIFSRSLGAKSDAVDSYESGG